MTVRAPFALLLLSLVQPAQARPEMPANPQASSEAALPTVPAVNAPVPPAGVSVPESARSIVGGDFAALGKQSMQAVDWAASHTQDLLATALSSLGVKYHRGASDPSVGFDCSGFVRHVYKEAVGLLLPHNAYSMSLQGKPVAAADLKPGDLVFFNTLKHQFSHVGIYLGDDRFIHAPSAGKGVQVDKLSDSYWVRHFEGARRIDTEAGGPELRNGQN